MSVNLHQNARRQRPDEDARRYRFAGIDRVTRGVDVEVLPEKSATCTQSFLERLLTAAPFKVTRVLQAVTDRCCATGQRQPTGNPLCDQVGVPHAIDHRLIKPRHPPTKGRVERCNGRIAEVLATHRCRSGEHRQDTLIHGVSIDHHHIPHAPSATSPRAGAAGLALIEARSVPLRSKQFVGP